MTTLALEFSSSRRAVAVLRDGQLLAEVAEAGGLASRPFGAIERALEIAGVGRDAVTDLAVGIGPGSYTGIRIAIAVAQGWSLAVPVATRGVDAFSALRAADAAAGLDGPVTYAIDAQRGEFAVRTWTGSGWEAPPGLVAGAELERLAAAGTRLRGPRPEDGASWIDPGTEGVCPTAEWIGRVAPDFPPLAPWELAAMHLRPVAFAKAPPARPVDLPPGTELG